MAEVATAGTLIGAVLETAGYITQEQILVDFKDFFNAFGAFLYILAGIGAVISVAMFGSYRMARYLLLGPALFWFLIGPVTDTEGVAWKLGGGAPRDQSGPTSISDSAAYSRELAEKSRKDRNANNYDSVKTSAQVSSVFRWVTKHINSFVSTVSDAILKYEDDEDLLFIARTRALEILLNAEPQNSELLQMFEENLFGGCGKMMQASLALSSGNLSKNFENILLKNAALDESNGYPRNADAKRQEVALIDRTRAHYEGLYDEYKQIPVKPQKATLDFMARYQDQSGASQAVFQKYLQSIGGSGRVEDYRNSINMTCEDLSAITQQAILTHAEEIYKIAEEELPEELRNDPEKQEEMCLMLRRKLTTAGVNDADDCDLTLAVSFLLIRNSLQRRGQERILQRHIKDSTPIQPVAAGTIAVLDHGGQMSNVEIAGGQDNPDIRIRDDRLMVREKGKRGRNAWHTFTVLSEIEGHKEAAFVQHQRYQTRELRQKIFSFAVNLPYYQGLLLYFLSVSYPFIALMAIVPSRAPVVLQWPLYWLWVKSWDIGVAAVIVFDKVLWNLFPTNDFPVDVCRIEESGCDFQLPEILTEAFKSDPLYNVHAYYFLLSLALTSVPPITGYAILKVRKNILSSFSHGAQAAANESMSRAGGVYGVEMQNRAMRSVNSLIGTAHRSVGSMSEGLMGGGSSRGSAQGAPSAEGAIGTMGSAMSRAASIATGGAGGDGIAGVSGGGSGARGGGAPGLSMGELASRITGASREVTDGAMNAVGVGAHDVLSPGNSSRGAHAVAFGAVSAATTALNSGLSGKTALSAVQAGARTTADMVATLAQHDAKFKAVFDPHFGRWGKYPMMQASMYAAMDAEGGFVIDPYKMAKDPMAAKVSLYEKEIGLFSELLKGVTDKGVRKITPRDESKGLPGYIGRFFEPVANYINTLPKDGRTRKAIDRVSNMPLFKIVAMGTYLWSKDWFNTGIPTYKELSKPYLYTNSGKPGSWETVPVKVRKRKN